MGTKYVYSFNEGNKDMKSLLGGKGANLAEMTKIGLPVPPVGTYSDTGRARDIVLCRLCQYLQLI